MKKLLLIGLLLSSNFMYSQICVNFQDTTLYDNIAQTSYGSPFYSSTGIDFRCKFVNISQYTPPIPTITVDTSSAWNFYNSNFSGNLLWLGDVYVQIDFTGLSFTNRKISFDISYASNPTDVNAFNVNGAGLTVLPSGVVYTYTTLSTGIHVEIKGLINTIEIMGFEVAIDNLCAQQVVPTAINDLNNKNTFTIYPNPTQNSIYLSSVNKIEKIVLVDLLGSIVQEEVTPISGQLNLSNLKPGAYFVQVYFDDQVISKKIIKQDL